MKKDYNVTFDETVRSFGEIEKIMKKIPIILTNGISTSKINSHCQSEQNVAIIIPHRDRLNNLLIFLNNMHVFLTKQKITYGIFIV